MGTLRYNGLHWNVGGEVTTPQPQYNAGQGFSAAFVLAIGNISYNGITTSYNGWQEACQWIKDNAKRQGEKPVLRLYWPRGNTLGSDPGQSLGTAFYYQIVKPAIDRFDIRNFQVLDELNEEYEPYKTRSALSGDMYNIAWWIKHLAVQEGRGWVYLGFPGPGGTDEQRPSSTAWNSYWDSYKTNITKSTEQGAAYNWLAVHTYEFSGDGLAARMEAQYDSLRGKFPEYPQRYTEYGIPIEVYQVPDPYQDRANYYKSAIQRFRNYVNARTGPDVWSVFSYIAYNTSPEAQDGVDGRYELVRDNNNLGPAQTLASAF